MTCFEKCENLKNLNLLQQIRGLGPHDTESGSIEAADRWAISLRRAMLALSAWDLESPDIPYRHLGRLLGYV
jgi:hypothetical protein